jgi:hypothetical protein
MFLVLLRHSGPEWVLALPMEQQSKWREHANYMDELVDAGVTALGGPLDDLRVVLAIEAESEETVRDILARIRGARRIWLSTPLTPGASGSTGARAVGRGGGHRRRMGGLPVLGSATGTAAAAVTVCTGRVEREEVRRRDDDRFRASGG